MGDTSYHVEGPILLIDAETGRPVANIRLSGGVTADEIGKAAAKGVLARLDRSSLAEEGILLRFFLETEDDREVELSDVTVHLTDEEGKTYVCDYLGQNLFCAIVPTDITIIYVSVEYQGEFSEEAEYWLSDGYEFSVSLPAPPDVADDTEDDEGGA